ncbi:large conductance mechanosensitive channel protein MscL [Actinospica durhamensis]|uniref:Large conductance mechanosensitive channel protein MscL n=1 Tax=Actinospica durhamensis TaxID=1508375 RepID=A0A941EX27_9ACTN|nr:large conductance mechanosensitive channel protein MscL [Actinospica durhamensis]MBR7838898.1 large conductance mechanosensitive channel protein MscL [Actinospica durhamensis]
MKGFRQFILRGNLVDLAVAVVIGGQFSSLVKGLTTSFINPLLSLFGNQQSLDKYQFTVKHSVFTYGQFVDDLISFVVASAVIYFLVVHPVARLLRMFAKDQASNERNCPFCTRSIPLAAVRCPECTSVLTEGTPAAADLPDPRPAPAPVR